MSRSVSSAARRYSNRDLDSSRVTRSSSGTASTSGGRSSGRARRAPGALGLSGGALRLQMGGLGVEAGEGICTLLSVGIEPLGRFVKVFPLTWSAQFAQRHVCHLLRVE